MVSSKIILISLPIILSSSLCSSINLTLFQQEALMQHNIRRQQHCVSPMTLNSTLNAIAQNYAVFLANNSLFNHSYYSGLGENLWAISSSGILGVINGSRAVESWYSEISSYNFSSPGYSSGVGHFTQLVWRTSIQLGIGIAYNGNNTRAVVVANYQPQGNIVFTGSFANNVLPVCTSTTTAATATSASTATSTVSNSVAMTMAQAQTSGIASVATCLYWFSVWPKF